MESKSRSKEQRTVKVSVSCKVCYERRIIEDVLLADYNAWIHGKLIQQALPYLSGEDRDLLVTNICPKCWDGIFSANENR